MTGAISENLVYFIACAGRIKIGITKNLKARVGALQTSAPDKLTVLAVIPGSVKLERDLHAQLYKHRTTGEWFADCDEVREAINTYVSRHSGIFNPDIRVQIRRASPPREATVQAAPEEWDIAGRMLATRRATVEHYSALVDSPVLQDMSRARDLERSLSVKPGSIIKKIYQCDNPVDLHRETMLRLDRLFAKSSAVGDRITLAILNEDFSAGAGLVRANEVLIELADAAMAPLKAVHRPFVNQ